MESAWTEGGRWGPGHIADLEADSSDSEPTAAARTETERRGLSGARMETRLVITGDADSDQDQAPAQATGKPGSSTPACPSGEGGAQRK